MAKSKIDWNEWLSPQRVIVLGILALIATVIITLLWKKISASVKNIIDDVQNQNQLEEDIASTGQQPSYSDSRYEQWADQLETAMYGAGTDEQMVYQVMNYMKNDADVLKLISAFGTRKGFLQWNAQTLPQWIQGDFSDRTEINNILKAKGISYRF